jgi:hypothetical protein
MSLQLINKMFSEFYRGYSTSHLGYQSIYWISESSDYVIFKVKGHSCYGDRMSGTGYVPTSFFLYRVNWDFNKQELRYGTKSHTEDSTLLYSGEGRITKQVMAIIMDIIEKDKKKQNEK